MQPLCRYKHTSQTQLQRNTPTSNTDIMIHIHTNTASKAHSNRHWLTPLCVISGVRPPRPAYTPSLNGNLYTCDMPGTSQRDHPVSSKWQRRLQDMLTPSSSRAYAMGCAIITLLLLTVLLIFYFLGEISHQFIFIGFPSSFPGYMNYNSLTTNYSL